MTKIYSIESLNAERDSKEVGTLFREHNKFYWTHNVNVEIVFHDEQIPVETKYKQRDVKFEYMPLKWRGATIPGPSEQSAAVYPQASTPLSVRARKKDGSPVTENRVYESIGEIEQQGKVWASQRELTITMLDIVPKRTLISKPEIDEYDWMWRVFDKKHMFTDNGRKISIDWGAKWSTVFGSKPTRDIWQEELRLGKSKFYEDSDSENEDIKNGNWQDVVVAHLTYFSELLHSVMRKHKDKIPVDEATGVAMLAICEFAYKLSNNDEDLRARFATAAYSWVRNYYREAVDTKDTISSKSLAKVQDLRTITDLLKELNSKLDYVTIEDICRETGFGEKRVNSTFSIFDFNIGKYRDSNPEELLYTVMQKRLTERQASILEMNFGLNGSKYTIPEIAKEMNVNEKTIRRDRSKAMEIIKLELGDKLS